MRPTARLTRTVLVLTSTVAVLLSLTGPAGLGGVAAEAAPAAAAARTTVQPVAPGVSSGGRHTCAVRPDASLWCWGANGYGQLGLGDTAYRTAPVQVGTDLDWASVSTGGLHTCGIHTDGTLWCWGLGYRGQLGEGSFRDQPVPHQIVGDQDWVQVSTGTVHTCATELDGTAWCWGDNSFGQLGNGSSTTVNLPTEVPGGAVWRELRVGGWSTCGVRTDDTAWCWGRNLDGELGIGSTGARKLPTQVVGTGWRSVEPSWNHACGLHLDGSLQCWGANDEDQLGTGTGAPSTSPTTVTGAHTFTSFSVGLGFGCGLDDARHLWCWGTGRYGQLGAADHRSATPVPLAAATTWSQVDAGWLHACASDDAGNVQCWGNNEAGAVGDGTLDDVLTPQTVAFVPATTPVPPAPTSGRPARAGTNAAARIPASDRGRVGTAAPSGRRTPARRVGSFGFNLVSINVLGSNHTAPRHDAADFSFARVRAEWTLDRWREVSASIVGMQEVQADQLHWLEHGGDSTYDFWPGTTIGPGGVQTTIAWKQRDWTLQASGSVQIPFQGQTRKMPLVRLRNTATGRDIWVMNIHNAPQGAAAERRKAVALETARLKKIKGSAPIFLVGDFNDHARAFCQVTDKVDLVAARGGNNNGRRCSPPSGRLRVDWIFGSHGPAFSRYTEDRSNLVQRITDHAVLETHVQVS